MAKLSCSRLNNSAFSLLELIIGVAILSIGIVVILQAFSFSARIAGLSCDIIDAVFLAEDKIQELEFKERQNLIINEIVRDKKGKFEWGYEVNLDSGVNLHRLSLDIGWQKLNRKEELKFNTLLR